MTYLVSQLVSKSWYLSGIVGRNLETVQGDQLSDGVDLLNSLLAINNADIRYIPYFTGVLTGNFITGQELYFFPNLLDIETLTFYIDNLRYPMSKIDRVAYFGSARVNVLTLPLTYFFERVYGGSNIYIYPFPTQNYQYNLVGKQGLSQVTYNQDLSLTLDLFYIEYLRYALAKYMCDYYNIACPPEVLNTLDKYDKKISSEISPKDLSVHKISSFKNNQSGLTWGDVNIGKGYRPNMGLWS